MPRLLPRIRIWHRGALVLTAALAALPAFAARDWSRARPVTMATSEYRFSPQELTLRRGVAYRLHLENHGKELHEFHAPRFFKSAELRNPAVLNADRTEIVLHPGDAKDVYLVPEKAGKYSLSCPDHDWAGMTGEIVVR